MFEGPKRLERSAAFTWADHRALHAFRSVLHRHGGRQTIATDYDFSPEVVEIFAPGRDEAAFIVWRDAEGIAAMELGGEPRPVLAANITECLDRIGSSLARSE